MERTHCRGKADPSAPHDLRLEGALRADGSCKRCREYTDRKAEARRKAQRRPDVLRRRLERSRVCVGKQDPTAPHDLTLPGALTEKGKCARCHKFTSQRSQRKGRARAKALAKETKERLSREALSGSVRDDDRGVPVYPKSPPNSREAGFWAAENRFRSVSLEEADFAGVFLDDWPLECVQDSAREGRVPGETDYEFATFRRAMVSLANRKDLTPYTRALAWKALTDTRGEE